MEWGGRESLLAKDCGRTKWPCGDIGRRSTGAGGRLRATFTVQRGHPPSAPAFSCWKDLSEGWGLPGEGMEDWEPSPPLWLALLKICQTLQCKNRRETGKDGGRGFGPRDRGWQALKFQSLASVGQCLQAQTLVQPDFLRKGYSRPRRHPSSGSSWNQTHTEPPAVTEPGKHHSKGLSSLGTHSCWHKHRAQPRKMAGKHLQPGGLPTP